MKLSIDQGCFISRNHVTIPKILQPKVLKSLHEAHSGMSRTKSLARSYFWWVKMEDIEKRVKTFESCQKHQLVSASAPVHQCERRNNLWVKLPIDYSGPFMGKMLLVIVDSYSKWVEIFPVSNSTCRTIINCLRTCFTTHGLPQTGGSDNELYFTSEEFECFMKRNSILHIKSAPYHPPTNGCNSKRKLSRLYFKS